MVIPQVIYTRRISSAMKLYSEELNVHRDSEDNHAKTPFEFTEANMMVSVWNVEYITCSKS